MHGTTLQKFQSQVAEKQATFQYWTRMRGMVKGLLNALLMREIFHSTKHNLLTIPGLENQLQG
jgi:hypothetical protein